ncbi:hypothetical protein CRG98_044617 [Punica granatum]|uniref:Uncharacterized protein n=1 Tax=Punica granatum TaxID=22663 RepID=A0A2I0HUN4_PUNGR|nr:hypothetical protein CRG98_044617 [Punica granatum]
MQPFSRLLPRNRRLDRRHCGNSGPRLLKWWPVSPSSLRGGDAGIILTASSSWLRAGFACGLPPVILASKSRLVLDDQSLHCAVHIRSDGIPGQHQGPRFLLLPGLLISETSMEGDSLVTATPTGHSKYKSSYSVCISCSP